MSTTSNKSLPPNTKHPSRCSTNASKPARPSTGKARLPRHLPLGRLPRSLLHRPVSLAERTRIRTPRPARAWRRRTQTCSLRPLEEDTLTYVPLCRKRFTNRSPSKQKNRCPSGFLVQITRGEMHLVNIRHIQHHTGQLSAYLRRVDEIQGPKELALDRQRLAINRLRCGRCIFDRLPHFRQPLIRRNPIRPEFFQRAEVFARQQAAVLAQFRGGRIVEEAGRVGALIWNAIRISNSRIAIGRACG